MDWSLCVDPQTGQDVLLGRLQEIEPVIGKAEGMAAGEQGYQGGSQESVYGLWTANKTLMKRLQPRQPT